MTWSVDGDVYQHRTPADIDGNPLIFNKPFFLMLNLAAGGDWPGNPEGSTTFPLELVFDHVDVTTSDVAPSRPEPTWRVAPESGRT